MPLLIYSYPDFVPFTVIKSAQINAKYNDIKTLLNVTKLDDTNIQDAGITRATKLKAGTPNYILLNDNTGKMSEEQYVLPSQGGTGTSLTLAGNQNKVLQVDSSGTSIVLGVTPGNPGSLLYTFSHFS
jgi:hypothetical protein